MSTWSCDDCGWTWPLAGPPPAEAECDSCGGELTTGLTPELVEAAADAIARAIDEA